MTGLIPDSFVQSLLSRIDIIEIIQPRVPLKKAGANYSACCPFHNEKTPSFSVNQTKQFYHCFGCGVSGDAIQFLIEYDKLSFVEAIEVLARQAGVEVPVTEKQREIAQQDETVYDILAKAGGYFEQQLREHPQAARAVSYFKNRGLTGHIAKQYRLGFAPSGWDGLLRRLGQRPPQRDLCVRAGLVIRNDAGRHYDRFRDRVMFPIRDRRGRILGFGGRVIDEGEPKYLNSPETPVFNKSQTLYGLYEVRKSVRHLSQLIVVEGYMDVLSLVQAGIPNVVATLGTACTEQHVQLMFRSVPEIVFCFDGDKAGQKAAWRALETCMPLIEGGRRVKFLMLPKGEDPDSYVRANGNEAFTTLVTKAYSLPDFMFNTLVGQVDMGQIDGRVELANTAKQVISRLPAGVFQQMMFDRLGQLVGLDSDLIQGKVSATTTPREKQPGWRDNRKQWSTNRTTNSSSTKFRLPPLSPAIRAAALLLSHRDVLLEIIPNLTELEANPIHGSAFLVALAKILQAQPDANDATIVQQLSKDVVGFFVPDELRGIASSVPSDGLQQEFLGAVEWIRLQAKEQAMDTLLMKAKQTNLSADDKASLQQMLLEKGKSVD